MGTVCDDALVLVGVRAQQHRHAPEEQERDRVRLADPDDEQGQTDDAQHDADVVEEAQAVVRRPREAVLVRVEQAESSPAQDLLEGPGQLDGQQVGEEHRHDHHDADEEHDQVGRGVEAEQILEQAAAEAVAGLHDAVPRATDVSGGRRHCCLLLRQWRDEL